MPSQRMALSRSFVEFFESEKAGGVALIACTVVSLALANSAFGAGYLGWNTDSGIDRSKPCFVCAHCGAAMTILQTLVRGQSIRAPPAYPSEP